MATHEDNSVLENIAGILMKEFGQMKVNKGNEYKFLGMNIKLLDNKEIEIDMIEQLREIIEYFEKLTGEIIPEERITPTVGHIFKVNENKEQLGPEKSAVFHSVTQKLLYVMKRARPDIETGVSFLMRCVSKSDLDD